VGSNQVDDDCENPHSLPWHQVRGMRATRGKLLSKGEMEAAVELFRIALLFEERGGDYMRVRSWGLTQNRDGAGMLCLNRGFED
jgi:hypothetical protein